MTKLGQNRRKIFFTERNNSMKNIFQRATKSIKNKRRWRAWTVIAGKWHNGFIAIVSPVKFIESVNRYNNTFSPVYICLFLGLVLIITGYKIREKCVRWKIFSAGWKKRIQWKIFSTDEWQNSYKLRKIFLNLLENYWTNIRLTDHTGIEKNNF